MPRRSDDDLVAPERGAYGEGPVGEMPACPPPRDGADFPHAGIAREVAECIDVRAASRGHMNLQVVDVANGEMQAVRREPGESLAQVPLEARIGDQAGQRIA